MTADVSSLKRNEVVDSANLYHARLYFDFMPPF